MANEEGRLRFVNDEYMPGNNDVRADYIYCLDLKWLNPDSAHAWIANTQHVYSKYDVAKVPTVVVMGSSDELSYYGPQFIKAGAILWEKPVAFDDLDEDEKRTVLEIDFSYPEKEGPFESQGWSEGGEGDWLVSQRPDGPHEREEPDSAGPRSHHKIYVDPPYQLGAEDFERLVDRMRMPDDDPRKDD